MSSFTVPEELKEVFSDFPAGPLDEYRKKASFDWKLMKYEFIGEDKLKFVHNVWSHIKSNPVFDQPLYTLPLPEQRRITYQRWKAIEQQQFYDNNDLTGTMNMTDAISQYDMSLGAKIQLNNQVFRVTINFMGTERHEHFLEEIDDHKIFGAFALTELAHGSNTRAMQTEAHYHVKTQQFIIKSPGLNSTKIWVGNLGQMATHCTLYAQLYTTDANGQPQRHGLHTFVVPLRDKFTLRPFPGVIIGDMGEKLGWNALDNGWLRFNDYAIPRENLLNKVADVTPDGRYVSKFKSERDRQSSSLGSLSLGRVGICSQGSVASRLASVIAVRYSAVRKQFGPDNNVEWSIIEYPLQQRRLFPYLAASFVTQKFFECLLSHTFDYMMQSMQSSADGNRAQVAAAGREMHAITSVCKPLSTWTGNRAVQECREACGGHGFHRSARLADLKTDFDGAVTYEGENNMLLAQGSSYLQSLYRSWRDEKTRITSPFHSVDFLGDYLTNVDSMTAPATVNAGNVLEVATKALKWLMAYLVRSSTDKYEQEVRSGKTQFEAGLHSQMHRAHTLALVYAYHTMIDWYMGWVNNATRSPSLVPVLKKLGALYAATALELFTVHLYVGGYCRSNKLFGEQLMSSIETLCADLKDDAVALVDALAPPDHILNSTIGASDGKAYDRLFQSMLYAPESVQRPEFWADYVQFLKSKL